MANVKISDLTPASAAADANEFEINEAGTSKKVTGSQLKSYVNAGDGALAAKNTVATADIDNLAVTTSKLAADAVDGTKIADDAIANEHIATGAVNADSIAAGAVGSSELATDAVTNAKVANDAIGIAELSATGTPSSSTYLRGDNTWASVSGGVTSGSQSFTTSYNCQAQATGNNVRAGGYAQNNSFGATSVNVGVKSGNTNFQKNLITYVNNCNQQPTGRWAGAETFVSGSTVYVRAHSRYQNCAANCVCNC